MASLRREANSYMECCPKYSFGYEFACHLHSAATLVNSWLYGYNGIGSNSKVLENPLIKLSKDIEDKFKMKMVVAVNRHILYGAQQIEYEPIEYDGTIEDFKKMFVSELRKAQKYGEDSFRIGHFFFEVSSHVDTEGDVLPWLIPVYTIDEWFKRSIRLNKNGKPKS